MLKNILTSLFRKKEKSFFKHWAEKNAVPGNTKKSDEVLFAAIIYAITRFEMPENTFNKYNIDVIYFELCSYVFIIMSLWMLHNKPDCQREITVSLMSQYVILTKTAFSFSTENALSLIEERTKKYFFRLSDKKYAEAKELLLNSIDNSINVSVPKSIKHFNTNTLNVDTMLITCVLTAWEATMVKAVLDSLENYINCVYDNR